MIDTQPYLNMIRRLLIEVLWANPCGRSEKWLCDLYPSNGVEKVFSYKLNGDPKVLIRQSYEWARHAKEKRHPTLVDVTRLRFYDIPNRMYFDELELMGKKHVDGKANLIVRPVAQVAATVASWAIEDSAALDPRSKADWARTIFIVSGNEWGK